MRRRRSLASVTIGLLAAWGLLLATSGLATAQVGPWPMLQQNLGHTGQSPLLGPQFPSVTPPPGAVKVWQGFDKIKMSPIVGQLMAELIVDGKASALDIAALRYARFDENDPVKTPYSYGVMG